MHHCLGAESLQDLPAPTLKEMKLINACAVTACFSHTAFRKL